MIPRLARNSIAECTAQEAEELMGLVADGLNDRAIAAAMSVSINWVIFHRKRLAREQTPTPTEAASVVRSADTRDFTSRFCGDPPLERSALAKKASSHVDG